MTLNESRSKNYTKLRNKYRKVKIYVTIVLFRTIEFVCPVAMTDLLHMGKSRRAWMNQYPLKQLCYNLLHVFGWIFFWHSVMLTIVTLIWMTDFTAPAWLLECKETLNLPVLKAVSWGVPSSSVSYHFHARSHFVETEKERKKKERKRENK